MDWGGRCGVGDGLQVWTNTTPVLRLLLGVMVLCCKVKENGCESSLLTWEGWVVVVDLQGGMANMIFRKLFLNDLKENTGGTKPQKAV